MVAFDNYRSARESLSQQCDVLETAWNLATQSSEFEKMASGEVAADSSEVLDLIAQARMRLQSDTIEVGIFGEVKRGKSTLINALVGRRVSSMRVTPETAIPVWVESGTNKTIAIYNDGTSEEVTDTHEAQKLATQRAEAKNGKRVVRVIQYTEVGWLPDGLRIVDTPGLQDPSLVDSYEERTMGELERVSAAIFMFVSPPGPASHEVQLLRRLAMHGVDKVFLVCNFYPDVWGDAGDREDVLSYIQRVVVDAAIEGSKNAPKEIKLYAVNAKAGLAAIEAEDEAAYLESGVGKLRSDVEEFLVNGALNSVTGATVERLHLAKSIVSNTLDQRERILKDPSRIDQAARDLEKAVESSKRTLSEIESAAVREGQEMGRHLGAILASPYETMLQRVAGASSRGELKSAVEGLENLVTGSQSRAATDFEQRSAAAVSKFERELLSSFGTTDSFAGSISSNNLGRTSMANPSIGAVSTRINWGDVAAVGGLTAAGSAIVGGSLAGGAGTALLVAGPVGWIIGAAAMGIVGLLGGSILGLFRGANTVSAQDRQRITTELSTMMGDARRFGESQGSAWGEAIASRLRSQRDRYLADKVRELDHVRRVLGDKATRDKALADIASTRARISRI